MKSLNGLKISTCHQLRLVNWHDGTTFIDDSTILTMFSTIGSFYWLDGFICPSAVSALASSNRFKVKNLVLYATLDLEYFDIIPSGESLSIEKGLKLKIEKLHLSAYHQLRSLKLYNCSVVVDVSCLDGIYDLAIYYCQNITDISPLNNRVSISYCNGISTYSMSFRSSRSLQIRIGCPEEL